jgi:hypothetical protein
MTDSNRSRVSWAKEALLGTLVTNARMRIARITGESLNFEPVMFTPAEIRADRMTADPTKVNERNDGGVNFELHYPISTCELGQLFESAMLNNWTLAPERDNDGTADAVITDIGTTANTAAFIFPPQSGVFAVGHLIQTSGFTNAANNTLVRVTTGGSTSLVATGAGWVAESVPPATARIKAVGAEGIAGDVTATASGLSCTALNFTALGIVPGMWIKVGGTAAGTRFTNVPANNDWIRAVTVTSTAIVADNLPAGWGVDNGATKTIRLFFGDIIRNGTLTIGLSIERSYTAQAVPTHILQRGMVVDQMDLDYTSEQAITGSASFMGMSGSQNTTANGTTYASQTTSTVLTSSASVGRIAVGGSVAAAPNWVKSLKLSVKNNMRMYNAVGTVSAVNIGQGEVDITGTIETYFGSNAYLTSLFSGVPTNINCRAAINSQAFITTLPRVTFTGGSPNAGGKNQDVVLPLAFTTSIDPATNCEVQFDRVEYFEV